MHFKSWFQKAQSAINLYLNEEDIDENQTRRSLLILLVFMIMALVAALANEFFNKGSIDRIDRYAIPVLVGVFLISFVGAFLKRFNNKKTMIVIYICSAFYLIIAYHNQYSQFFYHKGLLSQNTYWFSVLYVAAFLVFPMKIALGLVYTTVVLIFMITLLNIGIHSSSFYKNSDSFASIIQFLLAGLVIIVLQTQFGEQRDRIRSMRRAAYKDSLTDLSNRRAAEEKLKDLCESCQGYNLVMLDIDNFKTINDTYGHKSGDRVLIAVAQLATKHLSKDSMVARWGGEEFMLIMPKEPLSVTQEKLYDFREDLRNWRFENITGMTASFGIDVNTGDIHPDIVIKRADEAMYHAKRNGKDTVIVAGTKSL